MAKRTKTAKGKPAAGKAKKAPAIRWGLCTACGRMDGMPGSDRCLACYVYGLPTLPRFLADPGSGI